MKSERRERGILRFPYIASIAAIWKRFVRSSDQFVLALLAPMLLFSRSTLFSYFMIVLFLFSFSLAAQKISRHAEKHGESSAGILFLCGTLRDNFATAKLSRSRVTRVLLFSMGSSERLIPFREVYQGRAL